MQKKCQMCKLEKVLSEFFSAPFNGRASEVGVGMFCKQCHAEGRIKHGYGSFGDRFQTPEATLQHSAAQ